MNDPIGLKLRLSGSREPFVTELEEKLSDLVGILSKFIIERSYSSVTNNGHERLDLEHARSMCSSIIEEANILLGPKKSIELNKELDKIIKEYFKEGSKV
jgi:hypothetical protein